MSASGPEGTCRLHLPTSRGRVAHAGAARGVAPPAGLCFLHCFLHQVSSSVSKLVTGVELVARRVDRQLVSRISRPSRSGMAMSDALPSYSYCTCRTGSAPCSETASAACLAHMKRSGREIDSRRRGSVHCWFGFLAPPKTLSASRWQPSPRLVLAVASYRSAYVVHMFSVRTYMIDMWELKPPQCGAVHGHRPRGRINPTILICPCFRARAARAWAVGLGLVSTARIRALARRLTHNGGARRLLTSFLGSVSLDCLGMRTRLGWPRPDKLYRG